MKSLKHSHFKVGLTQRVEICPNYQERRDALDQRWVRWVQMFNMLPMILPNLSKDDVHAYLDSLNMTHIILTGGNTLSVLESDDVAPERDAFEHALLSEAIASSMPVLGVCRGMQMLHHYFGGVLSPIDGHVGKDHAIYYQDQYTYLGSRHVNSFHRWGIQFHHVHEDFKVLACDKDGWVEAMVHKHYPLLGIMWHPERMVSVHEHDRVILSEYFLRKNLIGPLGCKTGDLL